MRSPLARKLALLIKRAHFLNQHPEISINEFCDQLQSRREFLKQTALIPASLFIGGGAISSCASLPMPPTQIESVPNVIILGAGMAGLSCAYHLTKAKIKCSIYESSSRSGGRILTKENFNQEQMYCELGGELIDSNNQDIINLCKELAIEIETFADYDRGLEPNLYYIKNKLYTDRELLPVFQKFAKHLKKAKAKPPETIDRLSLAEFLSKIVDVEPWLLEVMRVAYVGESGVEADQQSALMMVGTIYDDFSKAVRFFGDSDESLKIRGGNSKLISALEKYLTSNGVSIKYGTPIVGIKENSLKIELLFKKDSGTESLQADRVICTLPFTKLREIDGVFNLTLHPMKKTCIREMKYGTNSKMMLGFEKPIWRNLPKPHSNGMVYTDLFDQNIWETSRLQKGSKGILTSFTGGREGENLSVGSIPEYLNSFEKIFPGLKKVFDSNSATFNWSKYVHSKGSYSVFGPGQMTQFADFSSRPELSNRLFFAGEHATTEFAGFINGAAYSGRLAAEKIKAQLQA